jgi:hypothetical protein
MYPTIRFDSILAQVYGSAVGTTPVEISGQNTAIYTPSLHRQGIFVANPFNSTQRIFLSPNASVASSGANAIWTLDPGQEKYIACNGGVVLYAVAAGASGGLVSVVEAQ